MRETRTAKAPQQKESGEEPEKTHVIDSYRFHDAGNSYGEEEEQEGKVLKLTHRVHDPMCRHIAVLEAPVRRDSPESPIRMWLTSREGDQMLLRRAVSPQSRSFRFASPIVHSRQWTRVECKPGNAPRDANYPGGASFAGPGSTLEVGPTTRRDFGLPNPSAPGASA